MSRTRVPLALAFPVLLAVATPVAAREDCPAFLLRWQGDGLTIERATIPAGETAVWTAGEESGFLDVILPVGTGGSGSDARTGAVQILRCDGASIERRVRRDGRETAFPPRRLDELRGQDIRVSVTRADGPPAAFRILGYDAVERDRGPVQNPFAAVPVPLGPHDALVFTDTTVHRRPGGVVGRIALDVHGHLFARGRVAGGAEGWFVIDTGAAQSVVARAALPEDAAIEEAATLEYSAAGRRVLEYAPQGATGPVHGVLGHATVERLELGGLSFDDATVAVMDGLPDLFGRPLIGILGLDLMRRARALVLELPPAAEGAGTLELRDDFPGERPAADTLPVSLVQEHLVLSARLGTSDTYLILDTGAPTLVLDRAAAVRAGLRTEVDRPARGLDGGAVASERGTLSRVGIGDIVLADVETRVADLRVFASLRGADQSIGLLGNAVLGRFGRVEIDLLDGWIRFRP